MGVSFISSCVHSGLTSTRVDVEADISNGLPRFLLVGLPDAAVSEARERVRSAMKNSGLTFPRTRVTVNLAPASVKKQGPMYDLAIALAILQADQQLTNPSLLQNTLVFGELALNGRIRPVNGALLAASMAKELGVNSLIVPAENAMEASQIDGIAVYAAHHLSELVTAINNDTLSPYARPTSHPAEQEDMFNIREVRGQEQAKRALVIAASGGHNLYLSGPPGSGKTLLARSAPSILPPLTENEAIEVTKIHSIAGLLPPETGLMAQRPFRQPHHSSSHVALIGGGTHPRPGEVTLAHRGVLFLDEFPEFSRHTIETLRQPLEDGSVTIARASGSFTFPAEFMLIAAANPCPCGYATEPSRTCTCLPSQIQRYKQRCSGPIMDRFDLFVSVPRVNTEKLTSLPTGKDAKEIRQLVNHARNKQRTRYASKRILTNQQLTTKELRTVCRLEGKAKMFLKKAADRFALSARSYTRVLKVARTIADLDDAEQIQLQHISEALQFRPPMP